MWSILMGSSLFKFQGMGCLLTRKDSRSLKNSDRDLIYLRWNTRTHTNRRLAEYRQRVSAASDYFQGRTLIALMFWLPKLSISYCPFLLSKRILAAAMI